MRVILIDDEPIALEVLSSILSKYKQVHIVGSYTDPLIALVEIEKVKPDVLFLDIEMGAINGLEIAHLFIEKRNAIEIVFVTAYSEYAVGAFELNAMDYLLKPVQENRLQKTLERLVENIKDTNQIETEYKALRVNSFGTFEVLDSRGNQLVWRTQKAKELFVYLWLQDNKPVSKDIILETIFNDRDIDKAATLLHTTIYQLRKNLRDLGCPKGIVYFNDSYQLNTSINSDLKELNSILGLGKYKEEDIIKILKIYKGNFLEMEGYLWSMAMQERYKLLVFNILDNFTSKELEEKDFKSLLKICLDLMYKMDPFNEEVARKMIKYYGKQGDRTRLEIFFKDYVDNLWDEMKLEPMESTENIYKRYLKN